MSISKPMSGFHLPTEILENIFAQIPLSELLLTHCLVCKEWSEIILNPVFMPWKKLYLSFKLNSKSLMSGYLINHAMKNEQYVQKFIVDTIAERHGLICRELYILNCISMMGSLHSVPEKHEVTMRRLCKHNLFEMADAYLKWLPYFVPKEYNVWHLITTIILHSKTVWDIYSVLKLLLLRPSLFVAKDVIDALYCLVIFLLKGVKKYHLPTRYHFLLYYVLYMYENRQEGAYVCDFSQSKHTGQQSILGYVSISSKKQLTHEQARIVHYDVKKTDIVKIVALAGTGKTTTLLKYCQARPHVRFLLVVYNKSVQMHCQMLFPKGNVVVKTAHSLAFTYQGRRFIAIKKLDGNLRVITIVDNLRQREHAGNRYKRARLVQDTVERFMNSVDPAITLSHVPEFDSDGKIVDDDYRLKVLLPDAEIIWQEMIKCHPLQKIKMTHDGYLKLWQLSKPRIQGYDVIMIDEAQDMNPAIFDVLIRQDVAKIVVGDPYQQIYQFRGAVNALQGLESSLTFYLTQSFRFGPEICYIGHCILERLLGLKNRTLVGSNHFDSISADPRKDIPKIQRAYLSRTNCALYKMAVKMCTSPDLLSKRMTFADGIEKYNFEDIIDIYKLSQIQRGFGTHATLQIKNKLISRFSTISALQSFAENASDKELMNKISMYLYSLNDTIKHVNLLKERCGSLPKEADITFSTIHKSKGLEWDWVILVDDMLPDGFTRTALSTNHDEFNLLYVSVTRAKKYLTINSSVLDAISLCYEKMEHLTSVKELPTVVKCLQCLSQIDAAKLEGPLVTKVSTLHLFESVLSGGFICSSCALKQVAFRAPSLPGFRSAGINIRRAL